MKLKTKSFKRMLALPVASAIIIGALGVFGAQDNPAKTISVNSVVPDSGQVSGGQTLTITGDFTPTKPTTMQAMTQEYCNTMNTYYGEAYAQANGTDEASKLITLTDIRNNQQYTIGKLADGNCWMLDNLKIEDYNATAADTDVATDFYIPALDISASGGGYDEQDNPYVYGPISGDTGIGDTNYGYLYNWAAATAGETMSSITSGTAPHSICPAGWRMPNGGGATLDNEFDILNAKMAGFVDNQDPAYQNVSGYYNNWLFDGPFRGVLSGYLKYYDQMEGVRGALWGSTLINVGSYPPAFAFSSGYTDISMQLIPYPRATGYAVRCLMTSATPPAPIVTIGGAAATVLSWDSRSITIKVPAHIAGKVDIVVARGMETFTLADSYEYIGEQSIAPAEPTLPAVPAVPNTGRKF